LALLSLLLLVASFSSVFADPGAVGFALGGLQFQKESRISMAKENLTIAADWEEGPSFESTITADYEFLNQTNRDVTIRMAFPVPDEVCGAANSPYDIFAEDGGGRPRTPFHVWAEGQEITYATEARAFRSSGYIPITPSDGGKEYTKILEQLGVTPQDCRSNPNLPESAKRKLTELGLLDRETGHENWTLRLKYYWMQKFPGKKITHIKITYPAMVGYSDVYLSKGWDRRVVQATDSLWNSELRDTCGGPELARSVRAEMSGPDSYITVAWVNFILVTANYWNGPIQDFTLTLQVPDDGDPSPFFGRTHVKFCWDGPVRRADAQHIIATAHEFSPKRNLHIGFFQVVK
jgi:Domain of unknown function (DUF4424)